MVILPLKKEIKHDLNLLERKITKASRGFSLRSKIQFSWNGSLSLLKSRSDVLYALLKSNADSMLTIQNLYGLVFVILNSFVATDLYDGADRHFLKIFLETCTPIF